MAAVQTLLAGRRVRLWFVAATLLPLAGLGWLGLAILEQDAAGAQSRLEERREQALDLAIAALARTVDEAEARVTAAAAEVPEPDPLDDAAPDGMTMVVFDRRGVVGRQGASLPYYPRPSAGIALTADPFPQATTGEFVRRDYTAVLSQLEPHTRAPDPTIRAEAWLRTARVARRAGDSDRALAAYRALELLGDARAGDWPAALAARQGRALLLLAAGRTTELREEANALWADLHGGRWVLTEVQFETARAQALEWSGQPHERAADDSVLALADAVGAVWRNWHVGLLVDAPARHRLTIRTDHGPALALWHASADRLVVLAAGSRWLETRWLSATQNRADELGVRLALTHDDRRFVGKLDAALGDRSSRAIADSSLA